MNNLIPPIMLMVTEILVHYKSLKDKCVVTPLLLNTIIIKHKYYIHIHVVNIYIIDR